MFTCSPGEFNQQTYKGIIIDSNEIKFQLVTQSTIVQINK